MQRKTMVSDSLNPYEIDEEESLDKTPLEEWVEYLKNGIINPETQAPGFDDDQNAAIYRISGTRHSGFTE